MNEITAREMLKDYHAKTPPDERVFGCPFTAPDSDRIHSYYHELCAVIFPKWAKKNFDPATTSLLHGSCPCNVMTHRYVKRRIEKFVKREV